MCAHFSSSVVVRRTQPADLLPHSGHRLRGCRHAQPGHNARYPRRPDFCSPFEGASAPCCHPNSQMKECMRTRSPQNQMPCRTQSSPHARTYRHIYPYQPSHVDQCTGMCVDRTSLPRTSETSAYRTTTAWRITATQIYLTASPALGTPPESRTTSDSAQTLINKKENTPSSRS